MKKVGLIVAGVVSLSAIIGGIIIARKIVSNKESE